ncbi:unnamed protein product [Effrenium voratum]|uniref:Uncharacterized protein n=1 Tax=Effrenium voratum TaxID=2562239 RepID=A0AA36J602_9DINO|nr:unnamed protein product [Effrenium voratum]CAJ1420998.1 unnamed protein product [Effrenium voratum]
MSPAPVSPNRPFSNLSKLSQASQDRQALEAAVEQYLTLPGQLEEEAESINLQEFFDDNGVILPVSPKNWSLAASPRPLSRSVPTEEKHGSLSTRQQLMNTQSALEKARKMADQQRKESQKKQEVVSSQAVDIQRLRHYHLLFSPLGYVPAGPVFKSHLSHMHIEESLPVHNGDQEELADEALTTKGPGSAMTNEQRSLLLAVFRKSIVKVTGKGQRTAMMYRWTWFRFLIHCKLVGPEDSWDRHYPADMKIAWALAGKIFSLFQEPNSNPPALSFSGWANALQAVIRAGGLYTKGPKVVEVVFQTFLPRAQEQLGITDEEAKKHQASTMSGASDRKRSVTATSRERSQSRTARSLSRSLSRSQSRGVSRSASRALSFFSGGGSNMGEDDEDLTNDDGKLPMVWQINLAEQQICEPECLQLLHEYKGLLEVLFHSYAEEPPEELCAQEPHLSAEKFTYMLKELRFYPDFVQQYSVTKHLNASMARHGDEWLSFSGFVECLCRVTFCFLNTYGNNAQQTSPSKFKMLWTLALLENRLPRWIRKGRTPRGDDDPSGSDSETEGFTGPPQGANSLWQRRDANFSISACKNEEIVLWPTMVVSGEGLRKLQFERLVSVNSRFDTEIDRALSTLR